MIDIRCSREGTKCTDCLIRYDCDFIEVTEIVDPYAFYEKGRADERAKVLEEFANAMIVLMPGHKQDILHIAEQLNSAK